MQRAERLGLVNADNGKVDAAELELYLFQALLDVSELHDLDAYTINNPQIVVTSAGENRYEMPTDYGRLIAPRVQNKRGLYIFDGVKSVDLEFLDPNAFARLVSVQDALPRFFSITRRQLYLNPTPDSNNSRDYTVRGIYIERIERPDLDAEVLLSYPSVLVDQSLFRLAGDMGKLTEALATTRSEGLAKLVSGPLGTVARVAQAAMRQPSKNAQT